VTELTRPWSRVEKMPVAVAGWVREAALCLTAMLTTSALLVPILELWNGRALRDVAEGSWESCRLAERAQSFSRARFVQRLTGELEPLLA